MLGAKKQFLYHQKLSAETEPLLSVGVLSAFGKYKWYSLLLQVPEEAATAAFLTCSIKK